MKASVELDQNGQVSTTLVGVGQRELLEKNLEDATNELDGEERKMLQELEENFFGFMPATHWETGEVANYWKIIKENHFQQNLDL